jgi:hypothetical protein
MSRVVLLAIRKKKKNIITIPRFCDDSGVPLHSSGPVLLLVHVLIVLGT